MAAGSIVKNVVEYIVTQIVEDTKSVKVDINVDKAVSWLDKGAQPSERAQKLLEISGAWAQWRSSKGEVVSIPTAPAEKVKSSSKANKKKEEATQEETSEESSEDTEEE